MQQMWTDIDDYINSHLIPTDPRLQHALDNTDTQGFSNHLAVAPNQGMFLQMLIQMNQCKRVLELGTFGAYSTIWLAKALPEDGYLLTVEGRDTHVIIAQENIDFANMPTNIELKKGRGADIMKQLIAEGSEPFDLIFMDIQMPIMNGYEATRAIRKLKSGQEIPIIAITAGTEKEEKCKCLEAGMNDYISKPILKGIIEETILKWTK